MSRYRIKTLLNAIWASLDAEFETAEAGTISVEHRAREIAFRNSIVATLKNPALKGKRLVKEVESLVQELIRLKRENPKDAIEATNAGHANTYTLYAAFCEALNDPGKGPQYYATLKEAKVAHEGHQSEINCTLVKSVVVVPSKEQMVRWLNDGRVTHYLVTETGVELESSFTPTTGA